MKNVRIAGAAGSALGLAAFLLAGCRRAEQLQPDRPRLTAGVALQDVSFYSTALKRQMDYRVFLPSTDLSGRKLPVVYLLHGAGDDYRTWSNYSGVAQYAGVAKTGGLILVMPEGASSYYLNAAEKLDDKYEDYLINDLISDVEARFPAATGRNNRAIVGVSMGGFAAVKLALSRPELFVFSGAFSPAVDVPGRRFSLKHAGQWLRFRTIFGPMGSKTRQAADPFILVRSTDPVVTPYLYVTAGEQEAMFEPIRLFASRLGERHFAYEFHAKPGGHDWGEWDAQIPGCFDRLLSHLKP
jgi:S-formylglutathione hydrolase FrmB